MENTVGLVTSDQNEGKKSKLDHCVGKHTSALMKIFCPEHGIVGDEDSPVNEETRRLLRFRLFAVSALLSLVVFLFSIRSIFVESFLTPGQIIALPILIICVFILFRKKDLTLHNLRRMEFVIFATTTLHLAVYHLLAIPHDGANSALGPISIYRAAMSFFAVIIVYGFFIPNKWKKTAVAASLMAITPFLTAISAWFLFPDSQEGLSKAFTLEHISYTGMVIFAATLAAAIGSHIVDMMRSRTHKIQETGMYQLGEKIGSGGMGEVWKAEHRLLARPAAIKVIRPEILGSKNGSEMEKLSSRFKREAQITAALRSPHTIELYDFGVTQTGSFYYVMEYLRGLDLDDLVTKHGPLPPERVIHLLGQAADSLGEAHKTGLIHRDIKPSNLFLTRLGLQSDFLKVLDFGLVKKEAGLVDEESKLTNEGVTTGTPAFMAPELALGKGEIDTRSDIYALGCVAYWLLTGFLVFEGETPMEIVVEHVKTPPVPPSDRTEVDIPQKLDELIMACLDKDPDKRPQSMIEFKSSLDHCNCTQPWSEDKAESWWNTHLPNVA